MINKKIIITGGPGSGKTEIINELEKRGYHVKHEIVRVLYKKGKNKGVNAFKDDPLGFTNKLVDYRINQFYSCSELNYNSNKPYIFFDRGIHDSFAYLNFLKKKHDYQKIICSFSYDFVFLLNPWKKIYIKDNERMESFKDSKKLFNYIKVIYKEAKIKTKIIMNDSVKNRVDYIISYLNNIK
ncbi:MAG: AAA family ATPase [Flavobacteriaceae bacterium]